MEIKIRYNTECTDGKLFWRVLLNGVEHLAEHVIIEVPSETTCDYLPDKNAYKHHITCVASQYEWKDKVLIIT